MARPRKAAEQSTSSIYRGADGHWHARVTMGRRPDGTTERKHVQRRTKAEVRDAVRELERSRDAGEYVWTSDDLTLAAWLEHWLENVLPMTARWKTLSTYRSQIRLHVVPALGARRMSEIQPEHLEAHYRRMQTEGHSTHTIRAVHRVLTSGMLWASTPGVTPRKSSGRYSMATSTGASTVLHDLRRGPWWES